MRSLTLLVLILSLYSKVSFGANSLPEFSFEERCGAVEMTVAVSQQDIFDYNSQEEILCDSLKKIQSNYIQSTLKDFDVIFEKHASACLNSITDENLDLWGLNSLLKSCYASFEDGHLEIDVKGAVEVFLPFNLRMIGEKFYISQSAGLSCSDSDFIVGDELISISGVDVADLYIDLHKFVSASSDSARNLFAVDSLTKRNFQLPKLGESEILINRSGKRVLLRKKWRFKNDLKAAKSIETLLKRKFESCDDKAVAVEEGYSSSQNLYPNARSKSLYLDLEGENKFLTISRPAYSDERVCYLKLATFRFDNVYDRGRKIDLWEVLEHFVDSCSVDGVPFILDLRHNNGGFISNMQKFVDLFVSKAEEGFINEVVLKRRRSERNLSEPCVEGSIENFEKSIYTTSLISRFCSAFSSEPIRDNGYSGQVYLLTSEACMSACDYAATFIGRMQNTVHIGSPSHGAMLLTSGRNESSGANRLYSFTVFDMAPYYFVSLETKDNMSEQVLICSDDGQTCLRQFEKTVTVPDVGYAVSLQDILSEPSGEGWRQKIEEYLDVQ